MGTVAYISPRLVVVPIVALAGVIVLAVRIGHRWLVRRASRRQPARPAVLLGLRRIARPAIVAAVLAGSTAAPVAIAGYGATVAGSVRLTLHGQAGLIRGANTVVVLARPVPVPAALAGRATAVLRINQMRVGPVQADVVGIDPQTFADGAFWHPQLAGPDLRELVAPVQPGEPAPAIAYGTALPEGIHELRLVDAPVATVRVRQEPLLPGTSGAYPLVYVHRDVLAAMAERSVASHEIWTRAGVPAALATGLPVAAVHTAGELIGDTLYEPVTFTFQYLVALASFGALVVVVGLVLYLEARTPAHRRAYALLRRMRLRQPAHLAALGVELGVPLAAGALGGMALAALAVPATADGFDLSPTVPPGPLVAVPVTLAVGVLVCVLAVAVAATLFAHARIHRARAGEVLRDTG